MKAKTILVNFVTWPAVGHAVEGIQAAFAYRQANPGCAVHLVLNSRTAVELAQICPWLSATYTVDIPTEESPVSAELFEHIPRDWDYVVFDGRHSPNAYGDCRSQARRYFRAGIASGDVRGPSVPYDPHARLRLPLPEENLAFARERVEADGVHVGLLPAGAAPRSQYYPSVSSWMRIIESLRERHPDVTVHLFGKLDPGGHPNTTSIARADVDSLLQRYDFCRDCFDIGLLNQLAVAQRCGVFVSPHTGFAFAVLAVGTPWLTISGGRWMEFFHVGVPFYSVLPDPRKYPAFDPESSARTVIDADGSERILLMCAQRIEEDLPEILDAAESLVAGRSTFEECLERYLRRRARLYDPPVRRWAVLYARPVKLRLRRMARMLQH
jgi:hypothetical protein